MRIFDALWQAYRAELQPTWVYTYQAIINGVTYGQAEIWSFDKTGGLAQDNFSIGNSPIQQLALSVVAKAGVTIPKNARAEIQVQITGASGPTLWHTLGVFFIEARKTLAGGKLDFKCMDRMAYTDVPYLIDGESLQAYPMPMDEAMTRIYTKLGTTLDARCTISHSLLMEYPNDLTMRQVLAFIASAHGGNFCITEDDKLRLVIPGYTGDVLAEINGSNATKTYAGNTAITWDSVSMIYTEDGAYYTSGTTHNADLEVTNPWATQAICDAVQDAINGYTYAPYSADQADLDPAIELGDYITIDGVPCNVWAWKWNKRLYCDIKIPSSTDTNTSEFGYQGTLAQAISKKVTLGASYFGTQISRSKGLQIERSDGTSRVLLNSETMAMQALVNGTMVNKLYFDPAQGTFVFDGLLTARAITIGSQTNFEAGYDPSDAIAAANAAAESASAAETAVNGLAPEGLIEIAKLGATIIVGGYLKTSLLTADNIQVGTIRSAGNESWLDLETGNFSFANEKLTFNGTQLVIEGIVRAKDTSGNYAELSDSSLLFYDVGNATPIGRIYMTADNKMILNCAGNEVQVTSLRGSIDAPPSSTGYIGLMKAFEGAYINNIHATEVSTLNEVISSNIHPSSGGSGTCGSSSYRYATVYAADGNFSDAVTAVSVAASAAVTGASVTATGAISGATAIANNMRPTTSNGGTCGSSAYKWSAVWATNGTIQTSSRKDKKNIRMILGKKTSKDCLQLLDKMADGLVTFQYRGKNGTKQLGIIADDIADETAYGLIGEKDIGEDGTFDYALKPLSITMLTIAGYRELREQNRSLEARIKAIEDRMQ